MYPLDDADLALIEINNPTPLVQKLVEEIRFLRDVCLAHEVALEEFARLQGELEETQEELMDLERQLARVHA